MNKIDLTVKTRKDAGAMMSHPLQTSPGHSFTGAMKLIADITARIAIGCD